MSVNLIVTLKSKTKTLVAFTEMMKQMKVNLPKAEGCHSVNIFQNNSDPCVFTLVEVWQSEKHHQAHINEFIKAGHWEKLSSHLASDPKNDFFKEI